MRVYDYDKLVNLEFNKDDGKLTPDFDTELWSIGGDPTPEFLLSLFTRAQIGVWNDSGFSTRCTRTSSSRRCARRPMPRASTPSTSCSASPPTRLPYIELYEADDIGAVNTRTWQNWTTQPSPVGQPITSYGYDTIIALRPGTEATASYPGVGWALAALVVLAVLAAGSSFLAQRREDREPIEIADAPA